VEDIRRFAIESRMVAESLLSDVHDQFQRCPEDIMPMRMLSLLLLPLRVVLVILACAAGWLASANTFAQTLDAQSKITRDLMAVVTSTVAPAVPWARLSNGELLVRVIVVSNSDDPSLGTLRAFLLSLGGSVYYNYTSIRAVATMVPASHLIELASRDDVLSISPNRAVTRTASQLQLTTGASTAPRPSGGGALDGSGIGIAVVDSGIDWNHQSAGTSLFGLKGLTRVHQEIDLARLGQSLEDLSWIGGVDVSALAATTLDGTRFSTMLSLLQQPRLTDPDPYGHGTHVASIAAGNAAYQWPDTTGVAPNANLFDVRVLNDEGVGNVADVIAGIDWVTQHARLLNIRVMNLSLAAGSTE
jgi:serine protease AprX